jgi:hypothetical protein
VYVVDSAGRGGGASTHVNHSRHVTVEVEFTLIECIRKHNKEGGGCTTTDLIDALRVEHDVTMHPRTLHNVLSSMGYCYGKANVIGKMNDVWYAARIRTFLIQYSQALKEEQAGQCIIVYTDESYVNACCIKTQVAIQMQHTEGTSTDRCITSSHRERTTHSNNIKRQRSALVVFTLPCYYSLLARSHSCTPTGSSSRSPSARKPRSSP